MQQEGIKVLVPTQMMHRFGELHNDCDIVYSGVSPSTDYAELKQIYKDYDVFCLNINTEYVSESYASQYEFSLDKWANATVAFVLIPKEFNMYKESRETFIEHIKITLEDYYNHGPLWGMAIINQQTQEVESEECFYYVDGFDENAKKFFNECKAKYNITQQEFDDAETIIKSHEPDVSPDVYMIEKETKD